MKLLKIANVFESQKDYLVRHRRSTLFEFYHKHSEELIIIH